MMELQKGHQGGRFLVSRQEGGGREEGAEWRVQVFWAIHTCTFRISLCMILGPWQLCLCSRTCAAAEYSALKITPLASPAPAPKSSLSLRKPVRKETWSLAAAWVLFLTAAASLLPGTAGRPWRFEQGCGAGS